MSLTKKVKANICFFSILTTQEKFRRCLSLLTWRRNSIVVGPNNEVINCCCSYNSYDASNNGARTAQSILLKSLFLTLIENTGYPPSMSLYLTSLTLIRHILYIFL